MRRISVISRTTKGKNERMALAATEKAKVCTSVRNRYLAVETIRLVGRRRLVPWAGAGGSPRERGSGSAGGLDTMFSQSYQRLAGGLGPRKNPSFGCPGAANSF